MKNTLSLVAIMFALNTATFAQEKNEKKEERKEEKSEIKSKLNVPAVVKTALSKKINQSFFHNMTI